MAAHSSILAWRIPWTEELVGYSPRGHREKDKLKRLSIQRQERGIIERRKHYVPRSWGKKESGKSEKQKENKGGQCDEQGRKVSRPGVRGQAGVTSQGHEVMSAFYTLYSRGPSKGYRRNQNSLPCGAQTGFEWGQEERQERAEDTRVVQVRAPPCVCRGSLAPGRPPWPWAQRGS